jgi:hypothetical protein
LGLVLISNKACAQQSVEVTWDPDQTGLVTGYRLFYGTQSGIYTNSIVFSDMNDVEIDGLQGGLTYYFSVQSTDAQGDVSPLSNEAAFSVAILQPVNLQLQIFPGGIYYVHGDVVPPGSWELDASTDLKNWNVLDFNSSDSVDHDDYMTAPHMFFRVVRH